MIPLKTSCIAASAFLLIGCAQTSAIAVDPALPADDPRQKALVVSECAIYFAAVAKLEQDGRRAAGDPTRNCPPEARSRPADINPMVSVPSVTQGYPQTLYQRMSARGLPQDLVDDIAKSNAFWNLVAQRDSSIADF
ncbi:hypothetical protein [Yoonia sp. SS1-5]|uniref:Uncharacterized protein n=1 Tax=Yoonia rhodophyticola TaxID=3137370 RepID=A0AAN0MB15_9RHOB